MERASHLPTRGPLFTSRPPFRRPVGRRSGRRPPPSAAPSAAQVRLASAKSAGVRRNTSRYAPSPPSRPRVASAERPPRPRPRPPSVGVCGTSVDFGGPSASRPPFSINWVKIGKIRIRPSAASAGRPAKTGPRPAASAVPSAARPRSRVRPMVRPRPPSVAVRENSAPRPPRVLPHLIPVRRPPAGRPQASRPAGGGLVRRTRREGGGPTSL